MPVSYNFRKGVDLPPWIWLRQFPGGSSQPGTSNQYDGVRYIYWIVQVGTTASGSASTTQLWRYCTWTNGWQFLGTTTAGNNGIDIEYDPQRNVLYLMPGVALTSWQVFNLNTTAVNIAGVTCPAWSLTTMAPILTTGANTGSSFTQPSWQSVPGAISETTLTASTPGPITTGSAGAGGTTTTITTNTNFFMPGQVGLLLTFTSGTQSGKGGIIQSVTNGTTAVLAGTSMTGAASSGDSFSLALPTGTSTGSNTTTTLNDTTAIATWTTNQYANSDVVITAGTGAGQRRRIASNTATALTLAAAVTGNANTGAWSVTPDATSVYQIQPSSDFLYYFVASTTTTAYKLDISQTTGAAWVAIAAAPATLAGGSNSFYPGETAPFSLLMTRGNATASIYYYNIGLNTYITPTMFSGGETFTTGASSCLLHGKKKLLITKEASQRNYILDLTTNIYEPFPMSMYAAPAANDGKRVRYVKTADGIEWVYQMRAGGQEFWRIPLEWL